MAKKRKVKSKTKRKVLDPHEMQRQIDENNEIIRGIVEILRDVARQVEQAKVARRPAKHRTNRRYSN